MSGSGELFKHRINWKAINLIIDKCTGYEDLGGDIKLSVRVICSRVGKGMSISSYPDKLDIWSNKYGFAHYDEYNSNKSEANKDSELIYCLSFLQCLVRKYVDDNKLREKLIRYLQKHGIEVKAPSKYELLFTLK